MKTLKPKKLYLNIYQLVCYLSLMIAAMPVVNYYCNWYITLLPYLLIFYKLAKYRSTLKDATILMAMAVLFTFLQFWGVYRNQQFIMWMINGIIVWLPCLNALYITRFSDDQFVKNYLQLLMIITAITSITTIIGLHAFPQASRELASGTAVYDTTKYMVRNIGGYEHIYGLVVLLPITIWIIKETSKIWRVINIICLFINLYCIYRSQYTIAIIIAVCVLVIMFLKKYRKIAVAVLAIMTIVLVVDSVSVLSFVSNIFLKASEYIGFDYVGDRLLQVSQLLDGVAVSTGTSTDRIEYYQNCWKGFVNNPIMGNNMFSYSESNVSGHTMVLDIMSGLGSIGLVCAFYSFWNAIKTLIRTSIKNCNSTVLYTWITFIFVSLLNPSCFMPIFMVLFVGSVCIYRLEN